MATPEFRHNVVTLPPVEDDTVDLWDIVVHLWRARWLIAMGTFSAALMGALGTLALPKTYEATATIFVAQPTFSSPLKAPPFSVEAYGRLAESDYIRDRLFEKLQTSNGPAPQVGQMRTVLYASREGPKPYLPLFGLTAQATTAEGVQRVANTWAQAFVEEQSKLALAVTAGSVRLVVEEFKQATEEIATAEQELEALRDRQSALLASARITAGVDPSREQDPISIPTGGGEGGRNVSVIVGGGGASSRGPKDAAVQAQEFRVLSLETRLGELRRELESSKINLVNVDGESPERAAQSAAVAAERALETERTVATRMRADYIASEAEIDRLTRAQLAQQTALQRRVDEVKAKLGRLQPQIGDAQIAEAQTEPDLRIGALATLPRTPIGPDMRMNVALATIIGLLVSLFGAWVLQRAT